MSIVRNHCPPSSCTTCVFTWLFVPLLTLIILLTFTLGIAIWFYVRECQKQIQEENIVLPVTAAQISWPIVSTLQHDGLQGGSNEIRTSAARDHSTAAVAKSRPKSVRLSPQIDNSRTESDKENHHTSQSGSLTLANSNTEPDITYMPAEPPPVLPKSSADDVAQYLDRLGEVFTPKEHQRTQDEVQLVFRGAEVKKLPKPARQDKVPMIEAKIVDLKKSKKGNLPDLYL